MPPLGILYLAAWLRKQGHECSIIDLAGAHDWKKTLTDESNKLDDASWVGLTATTPQYTLAQQIANNIRVRGFEIPIVVGGIHTTSLSHAGELDFIERDGFDSYCIGEGYNSVTKITDDLKSGAKLSRVYTEPILKDVNSLPFAARDLIDIKSYSYKLGDTPATTFYSQYGCPYACLSADSFISQGDSKQTRIDRLRIGDYVISTTGEKSVITAKRQTEPKQSYQLELESGEKIVGSADHPVLTKRGWVRISQLTENDEVFVSNAEKSSGNQRGNSMTQDTPINSAPCDARTGLQNKESQPAETNLATEIQ